MQQSSREARDLKIAYKVGTPELLANLENVRAKKPFSEEIINFCDMVSKRLLSDTRAKAFPDVVTLAFWMRRASVLELKKRFAEDQKTCRMGRGVAFHIAPSNVPVNYAYSLVTGLLCGNANVVRIPSGDFEQVEIINRAINSVLETEEAVKPYIMLLQYGHDDDVNTRLSRMADVRVLWGGDRTIGEFRKYPVKPRGTEIAFADRYSLAVIDSDAYLRMEDKRKAAKDFYNDTYLTDQNACTSPRGVVWTGSQTELAKEEFWRHVHAVVKEKYQMQWVQAVNKLTSAYLLAAAVGDVKKETAEDNLIVRMHVPRITRDMMEYKDNSGFFFETECTDIMELEDVCGDMGCQTIAYIGDREMFMPLIASGIKGVDRIVPMGKTMDFDLIWDGYDLYERFTRRIDLR